ncbi:MAG TPA: hypothetical protein VJI98_06510 [Candidatus Nanoarchaeia archaeon]|nr:hypothetical protein [Candidatus Nanoarchaeia archaeon]
MIPVREAAESDGEDASRLYNLVLTSIIDPNPSERLSAVNHLVRSYSPEIRSVEVIEAMILINTRKSDGTFEPFAVGQLPDKYARNISGVLTWNMDGDVISKLFRYLDFRH